MIKHILHFLFIIFVCINISYAETISMDWLNTDGSIYQTTTCNAGEDVILPPPPEKRGYTFKGWSEYTLLEYIESTGTQYINTGYQLSSVKERIIVEVCLTKNGESIVFGNMDNKRVNINLYNNTLYYRFGGISLNSKSATTTQKHKYELGQNSYVDGNLIYTFNNVTSVSDVPLYLFAGNNNPTPQCNISGKIYSFQIYDGNNTLSMNLIPAKRLSDNKVGMLDLVSEQFFTNQGTGEFIAGPAIGKK